MRSLVVLGVVPARRSLEMGTAVSWEEGVPGIVVVAAVEVGVGVPWKGGCGRRKLEGAPLGSLFLLDMIPKVFVIVDGLDGIIVVQRPLLQ